MEQQKNILDHLKPNRIESPEESFFANLADQISLEQNVPIKNNYKLKCYLGRPLVNLYRQLLHMQTYFSTNLLPNLEIYFESHFNSNPL